MPDLVLLLILLFGLTGCATLTQHMEPPRVSLAGLELEQLGLFEQRYLVRLRVQNPNDVSLPIAGMNFRLFLNDEEFASGLSNQQVTLPGFGEELVDVRVTSNLTRVIGQLQTMGQSGASSFNYRIAGHVKVLHRAIRYPFEHSGEVDLATGQMR